MRKRIVMFVFLSSLVFGEAVAQEPVTPWRNDPVFQRLATELDKVPAIDMHTHLLRPGQFDHHLAAPGHYNFVVHIRGSLRLFVSALVSQHSQTIGSRRSK